MSTDDQTGWAEREPSNPRECRSVAGYSACFYPGFVRRLAVVDDAGEIVVYEQDPADPFILPGGATKPWPSSQLDFSGGPNDRRFSLQVYDPEYEIDRIEVVLKAREGRVDGGGERVVIEETAASCPPDCQPG